ncbi:hypothetical protein Tco_1105875 [Tanacetum coccineum]
MSVKGVFEELKRRLVFLLRILTSPSCSGGFQIYMMHRKKGWVFVFDATWEGDRLRFKTIEALEVKDPTHDLEFNQDVQRFETILLVEWHEARKKIRWRFLCGKWDEIPWISLLVAATTQKRT